jgi:phosphate transport system substrate-binding protein
MASAEAMEKALELASDDKAIDEGAYTLPLRMDREGRTAGAYPITFASYVIACTRYATAEEAGAVKGYLEWVIDPEGQEVAAKETRTIPLPASLRKRIQPAVEAIEIR